MINETYDSFISRGGERAPPFFYWEFLVNKTPAIASVDLTLLNSGDAVRFEFEMYVAERHRPDISRQEASATARPALIVTNC